jgi:hypothetical protein
MRLMKLVLFFNFFLFLSLPHISFCEVNSSVTIEDTSYEKSNSVSIHSAKEHTNNLDLNFDSEEDRFGDENSSVSINIFGLNFATLFNQTKNQSLRILSSNAYLAYYARLTTSPPNLI